MIRTPARGLPGRSEQLRRELKNAWPLVCLLIYLYIYIYIYIHDIVLYYYYYYYLYYYYCYCYYYPDYIKCLNGLCPFVILVSFWFSCVLPCLLEWILLFFCPFVIPCVERYYTILEPPIYYSQLEPPIYCVDVVFLVSFCYSMRRSICRSFGSHKRMFEWLTLIRIL